MKKFILVIAVMVASVLSTFAQNDTVIYMANHPDYTRICLNRFDRVLVYGPDCQDYIWTVQVNGGYEQHPQGNPLTINGVFGDSYFIAYNGCDLEWDFQMHFTDDRGVPNSFTQNAWKHQGYPLTLEAVQPIGDSIYYDFFWSTGERTRTIEITEPGVYVCQIPAMCGTAIRTFIVRDNVEIELATCDLESNLNMVTWPITPAQAEYVDQVIIKRDGMQVGTANYADGYFLDNIGSDAASRTYTLVAIATDGTQCPIESYQKETIHMAYLTGINNSIELNWNTPTGYDLLGYNICEWHPGRDGDITVIDYVGAGVTSYTCSESAFDQGNVVVMGVEAGRTESRLLSNRSWETVGLDEIEGKTRRFEMYPNPTDGPVTIKSNEQNSENEFTVTITNLMGQTIATGMTEGGVFTFNEKLAPGLYFVDFGGNVYKLVVK